MESYQKQILKRRSTLNRDKLIGDSNKELKPIEIKASKIPTAIEQETEIQIRRVMRTMDECIVKLEFVANFPYFLRNEGTVLKKHVPEEQAQFIIDTCTRFLEDKKRKIYKDLVPESRIYPRLAEAIEVAYESKILRLKVERCDLKISPKAASLINSFKTLQAITKEKLQTDAVQEFQHNLKMKQAWDLNREAKNKITEIQQQIDDQQQHLGITVDEKETIIENLKNDVDQTINNFKLNCLKYIANSEKAMGRDATMSEIKQKTLKEKADAKSLEYENLLTSNLAAEKKLRAKKIKAEAQLVSWLAKYDADIGDRQAEYDVLKAGYDEEQRLLNELQAKMEELDVEYIPMKEQKAIEEQEEWERRAFEFLKVRSARRIQKWWRGILWRKAERRRIAKAKWLAKKEKMLNRKR